MSKGPDFEFDNSQMFVTNPAHGGKVTCEKCMGFIAVKDHVGVQDHQHRNDFPAIHFHRKCYIEKYGDHPPTCRCEECRFWGA